MAAGKLKQTDDRQDAKQIVRLSPLLLGQVADAAKAIVNGSLIVQFCGKCVHYNDDAEWNVTHAILSNSLAVSSPERRTRRNERVDVVMREHGLTHVGWLRQASSCCPLSGLDLDTQRVYEAHLPDSFAAMLDLAPKSSASGPVVFFYCLADASARKGDAAYNALVPAQHVVLDTSVNFSVVRILFGDASSQQLARAGGATVSSAGCFASSAADDCVQSSSNDASEETAVMASSGGESKCSAGLWESRSSGRLAAVEDELMAMSGM